jgi:hypothetical protein
VRPRETAVHSEGYGCSKSLALAELDADPDRLTAPRIRWNGRLVEVGWDDAYRAAKHLLRGVLRNMVDRVSLSIAVTLLPGISIALCWGPLWERDTSTPLPR